MKEKQRDPAFDFVCEIRENGADRAEYSAIKMFITKKCKGIKTCIKM